MTQVRIPPNGLAGPCPLRNRAILHCPTPWVFLLDSDAEPHPACLAEMGRALRAHPEVSVLSPRILHRDQPDRICFDGGRCHFLGEMCLENRDAELAGAGPATKWPTVASTTALLVRCADAIRAGLLDERLVFFREDLEFCLRLRALGFRILHVPSAVVYHASKGNGSSSSAPSLSPLHSRRVYYQTRNRWWTLLKLLEWRTLVLTFPVQVLYEMLNFLLALWKRQGIQYLSAFRDLAAHLPEILDTRREFQARRIFRDSELLGAPPLSWRPEVMSLTGAGRVKGGLDVLCGVWGRLVL